MRWTDPGGYASCQVGLSRPLNLQPWEIAYYGDLTVFDARSGAVVWDGRVEDPGRSAGADGQVWELTGMGGQAHTRDRTVPLIYVDTSLQSWERVDANATPGGTDGVGSDPSDPAGLRSARLLRIPQGTAVVPGSRVAVRYTPIWRAGGRLARVTYDWGVGQTATSLQVTADTRTDGVGSAHSIASQNWSSAGGSASRTVGSGAGTWPVGHNTVDITMRFSGAAGIVSADTWWLAVHRIAVRALLRTKAGADITAGYTTDTVLAHEVVADLLGRLLDQYDGATAIVAQTSHPISHLAYPDGVMPHQVLQDLLRIESGYTWRVWERTESGKFRFEWVPVAEEVRYEADVVDGYDSQGSADGLYDGVTVRWRTPAGAVQTTTVTSRVPALDAAGLHRTGMVDLGDEVGSAATAVQAGQQWLAQRQCPPNAGRLRIARPIRDLISGRMVQPWEIRPGLIRVRGILPRTDALNATSRDGVTIFRIAAAEYRASDAAATLELDSRPRTVPHMVAEAVSRAATRRR